MIRRFFSALFGAALAICPWNVAARSERPAWYAQSWCLSVGVGGGYVEARVWFDETAQSYEWSAVREGRDRPAGAMWRHGAGKTEREAKRAAEAAIEELQK